MIFRRVKRLAALGGGTAAAIVVAIICLDRLFPPPIERGKVVSAIVSDRHGRPLRAFPVEDGRWRLAATLDEIDPQFIESLIYIEDKRFYDHPGVDGFALARAIRGVLTSGKVTSGASTITMQTARLLEPRPRTIPSKLVEMVRAVQIEARLSKREILELYLTHAPYGGNIEGVRAASWAWFGREPEELSLDQIALLIALPQAPESRRPDRRSEAARSARAAILQRLAMGDHVTADRATDAADEEIPSSRAWLPADAWHASDSIRTQMDGAHEVRSTIDRQLQFAAERLVAALADRGGNGVQASAIIVQLDGRAVRAAVGSAGLQRSGGWLDLTNRRRSPGSTLKPLIYGMAFDDGIADGATLIRDLPARFASYRPENFDRTFRGEVTVAQALQHSLNVPAVHLLDRVGANRFVAALAFSGSMPTMPSGTESDAGLAVALGGLGMTLRDLVMLYAALGDDGRALPLVWIEDDVVIGNSAPGHQLLSAESAREVVTILAQSPPPPGRIPAALSLNAPRIAYKTGTSYGFRDAWAAGIGNGYAIVVWTGRPDAAPRPGVTGRQAALPTLFDLFDATSRIGNQIGSPDFESDADDIDQNRPMAQFNADDQPPTILFPPENAEVWVDRPGRGFVLSARGVGKLHWYAEGKPVPLDAGGASLWTPPGPGFYRLIVVDDFGRTRSTSVRVRTQ